LSSQSEEAAGAELGLEEAPDNFVDAELGATSLAGFSCVFPSFVVCVRYLFDAGFCTR